jgi:hypothetical protein
MAIIAAFAIIAAALMFALAYGMNEKWVRHCRKLTDLCNDQNDMMRKMNREWYEAYTKMVDMKAEAAENERD